MTNFEKSREKLIKLILERPDACAALVRTFSKSEAGLIKLAFCFETLTHPHARVLFRDILDEEWPTLERLTKPWVKKLNGTEQYKALVSLYLEFFSHCLSWTPDRFEDQGSLEFLREMKHSSLEKLLAGQLPSDIAILSVVMTPYEFNRICDVLTDFDRRQVAITRGRLARLPEGVAAGQAIDYIERLRNEVQKNRVAHAQAEEALRKVVAGLDREIGSPLLTLIEREMPTLNAILHENGYLETAQMIAKKIAEES